MIGAYVLVGDSTNFPMSIPVSAFFSVRENLIKTKLCLSKVAVKRSSGTASVKQGDNLLLSTVQLSIPSCINIVFGNCAIKRLWILLRVCFAEDIVSGGCQAIGTHSAVVLSFIVRLAV